MCFGPWPFNLFFPVLFLFDWVGALWPQLSKVLKLVHWASASSFPQCPCCSMSSVSNCSSCCLCIWFRGEPVSSYFSMACCSVVSHWCKWRMFIMLPCSQYALILVLEHGNFGIRLPPGCSHHGVSVHCSCVQILSFYATRWPVLPKCIQLILGSWYVASMLCCHCWMFSLSDALLMRSYLWWVLCQCGHADLCAA